MKKLLLILIALPMIGCMDTAEEYYKKAHDLGYEDEQYQLSIDNYTKCLRVDPDYLHTSLAYSSRGYMYHKLGNYKEAITDYTRAIEVNTENDIAFLGRGRVHSELGEYKLALADYTRAISLDPEKIDGYTSRALVHYELGNYRAFASDSRKVKEILNSY